MKLPGRRSPRLDISGRQQAILETIICLSSIVLPNQEGDRPLNFKKIRTTGKLDSTIYISPNLNNAPELLGKKVNNILLIYDVID